MPLGDDRLYEKGPAVLQVGDHDHRHHSRTQPDPAVHPFALLKTGSPSKKITLKIIVGSFGGGWDRGKPKPLPAHPEGSRYSRGVSPGIESPYAQQIF